MAGDLRVEGGFARDCAECGAGHVVAATASDWQCRVCGTVTSYRRCPRCDKMLFVGPKITAPHIKSWKCPGCRKDTRRGRWPAATISDLPDPAAVTSWGLEYYGPNIAAFISDPERRRMNGSILEMTGISGMANGGCTVFFDHDSAIVLIGDSSTGGDLTTRKSLRYRSVVAETWLPRPHPAHGGQVDRWTGGHNIYCRNTLWCNSFRCRSLLIYSQTWAFDTGAAGILRPSSMRRPMIHEMTRKKLGQRHLRTGRGNSAAPSTPRVLVDGEPPRLPNVRARREHDMAAHLRTGALPPPRPRGRTPNTSL